MPRPAAARYKARDSRPIHPLRRSHELRRGAPSCLSFFRWKQRCRAGERRPEAPLVTGTVFRVQVFFSSQLLGLPRGKMDTERRAAELTQLDALVPNGQLNPQNNPDESQGTDLDVSIPQEEAEALEDNPSPRLEKKGAARSCSQQGKRFLSCKYIACGLVLIFISIIIVQEVKRSGQQSHGTPCPSCPSGWFLLEGICYNFSREERNWTGSQDFCSSHNASLATLENKTKDVVTRYGGNKLYWICHRSPEQPWWRWPNGQNATLKIRGDGGDCAYLCGDEACVSRCSTEHHFVCTKPLNPTGT